MGSISGCLYLGNYHILRHFVSFQEPAVKHSPGTVALGLCTSLGFWGLVVLSDSFLWHSIFGLGFGALDFGLKSRGLESSARI